MAVFIDQAYLAQHPGFRDRVRVAVVTAAINVAAEIDDATETSRLRRAHSQNVLRDQDDWAERYAWAVASNPVIEFDSPDNDIQFTVNSQFNALAGAPPATA